MRRLCTLICTLLLLLFLFSLGAQAADQPDYAQADRILSGLYARLADEKTLANDVSTDAAERYLQTLPEVAPGTLRRHGDTLTWETRDGIACRFTPQVYQLVTKKHTAAPVPLPPARLPAKKTTDEARDVCLIAPYYGLDEQFDGIGGVYDHWGQMLATFTGGSYTLLAQDDATVDTLADALESCAVVLIDSHGQINEEETTTYICLNTNKGLTYRDYNYDPAIDGYHATYSGAGEDGIVYCHVDGHVIANHMERPAPGNFVWNGTCFGMKTQGISAPLMKKGVAAVYGYSQDVTFGADRYWMGALMDQLTSGKSLAQGVAAMKDTWGCWDFSPQLSRVNDWDPYWICRTLREARRNLAAFPVVVSAEDPYPAQPDGLQTVKSGWLLPRRDLRVRFQLPDGVKCPEIQGYMFYNGRLPTPSGKPRDESRSYHFEGWCRHTVEDTTSQPEDLLLPGGRFSFGYEEPGDPLAFGESSVTLYAVYTYDDDGKRFYTSRIPDGVYDPYDPSGLFSDMPYGTWYYPNVRFALSIGLVNGYTDGTFRPVASIRRSEMVTILYRMSGAPEVTGASAFSDVPETAWYADAVSWASENGIVTGYTDGTFRPNQAVSRAQLAVLLWRYAGAPGESQSADRFPDRDSVPGWAYSAMGWAIDQKLINGNLINAQSYLQPTNATTRAQFVTVMQRYLNIET